MILQFFGKNVSQQGIKCASFENMLPCLDPFLKCEIKEAKSMDEIKQEILEGHPVTARIVPRFQDDRHTVVIKGFDEDSWLINDPALGEMKVSMDAFDKRWRKTNRLYMKCEKKKEVI